MTAVAPEELGQAPMTRNCRASIVTTFALLKNGTRTGSMNTWQRTSRTRMWMAPSLIALSSLSESRVIQVSRTVDC